MTLLHTPVAFIGIGNMGLAMALRLRDAGQPVRVHDIDLRRHALAAAAGAELADSPAAVAAGCALLIVVVMLCPTIGPADVEQLAARLAEAGLGCLDAPMSGGPARARDGSMSLMVAAPPALWAAHQRLLQHVAARLFHVGERPGDGARTKLVNNLLAATNLAAAAEAIALAQQLGLDGAQTLAVIEQSSGHSWIGADRMTRALAGDFAPRAHTTLLAKDSALALAMAAEAGITPTLGTQAAAMFQAALAAGYGGEDDARLLSLVRQLWRPASREPALPARPKPC